MSWIEINLPYSYIAKYDYSSEPEEPNLDERAKIELGFTQKDVNALHDQLPSYSSNDKRIVARAKKMDEINEEIRSENLSHKDRVAKLKASSNKDVNKLGLYVERNKLLDWYDKQPEQIAHNTMINEAHAAHEAAANKLSFSGRDLANPGTLIEVMNGDKIEQYLIGDINPICGVCDDCKAFDVYTTTVLRYKVLWQKPESKNEE